MDAVIAGASWTILPATVIVALVMFIAGAFGITEVGFEREGIVAFCIALLLAFLAATWIAAL